MPFPLDVSRGYVKSRPESLLPEPAFSPSRTMFFYPIHEGAFKTDIAADFFAFNVLMPQDLVAFGQELLIKTQFPSPIHSRSLSTNTSDS